MNQILHLYIHWPFCKNKCHYCDFVAFEKHTEFINAYHKALCEEIRRFVTLRHNECLLPIRTIFFGGGTPSLYPLPLLVELCDLLRSLFDLSAVEEVTLEVNPGGITQDHLRAWKEVGINRLSIGVQVLDDEVLARLNRFQTQKDVEELFTYAPLYFSNLSADFIMGLPGVSEENWYKSIATALTWTLSHCSVYALMVHEQTPLYFNIKKGILKLPQEHTLTNLFTTTIDMLESSGFEHYEISNFARSGFQSIHNTAYWERKPYQGFGLGAASFDGERRTTNIKNLKRYLEVYNPLLSHKELVYHSTETLSPHQRELEELMLALRQKKGIDLHRVIYSKDSDKRKAVFDQIELLKSHKLIDEKEGRIFLTRQGILLENEILMRLM
jgi:oxygen-independent coproporphyrinogen-3 oxidase